MLVVMNLCKCTNMLLSNDDHFCCSTANRYVRKQRRSSAISNLHAKSRLKRKTANRVTPKISSIGYRHEPLGRKNRRCYRSLSRHRFGYSGSICAQRDDRGWSCQKKSCNAGEFSSKAFILACDFLYLVPNFIKQHFIRKVE